MDDFLTQIQCDELEDPAPDRDAVLRQMALEEEARDNYYRELARHDRNMGWGD